MDEKPSRLICGRARQFSVEERYELAIPQQSKLKVAPRSETCFYFQNGRLFEMRIGKNKSALSAARRTRGMMHSFSCEAWARMA